MSSIFALMWGLMGIVFSLAGKDFLEVAACFLVCGVFFGNAELNVFRHEIGANLEEIKRILNGGNDD